MEAIVYTTNTGFTGGYAALISKKTGLPVYTLSEAKNSVKPKAEVIYLGWLMASHIKGYKKAVQRYTVCAVCGVGMSSTGAHLSEVRSANAIEADMTLFTLQGGFDIRRLRGLNKLMMSMMSKAIIKELSEKKEKTPQDEDILDLMQNGGSRVCEENLADFFAWFESKKD